MYMRDVNERYQQTRGICDGSGNARCFQTLSLFLEKIWEKSEKFLQSIQEKSGQWSIFLGCIEISGLQSLKSKGLWLISE